MDHITRECADSDVDYRECGESDDRHVIRHPIRQCAALPSVRSIWRTGRCRRHVFKHLIAHTGALWCPRTSCGQSGHADVRVVPSCVSSTLSSFPRKRHATATKNRFVRWNPRARVTFRSGRGRRPVSLKTQVHTDSYASRGRKVLTPCELRHGPKEANVFGERKCRTKTER
jgi:hypothetical protein